MPVVNDLEHMDQKQLAGLLRAGFSYDVIEQMHEPDWRLVEHELGLSDREVVDSFRALYNTLAQTTLPPDRFRRYFDIKNNRITLEDLYSVLSKLVDLGTPGDNVRIQFERYKQGRMANLSHVETLSLLQKDPFDFDVYLTALENGLENEFALKLATKLNVSEFMNFQDAIAAGIPLMELQRFILVDLDKFGSKRSRPVYWYVMLRTGELELSHNETEQVIMSAGTRSQAIDMYLVLRRKGLSHRAAIKTFQHERFDEFLTLDGNEINLKHPILLEDLGYMLGLPEDIRDNLITVIAAK